MEPVLRFFPPHTHPLTLVSDPDGLLAEEATLAALTERGFTVLEETDPVRLRYRVEQARPFSAERPLVVVTDGSVADLPYDLWQQGHHINLDLHGFFPHFSYPVVRALSPTQRVRLSRSPAPAQVLGQRATVDCILQHAFAFDPSALREPSALIVWLESYHLASDPMPTALFDRALVHLRSNPGYAGWPLEAMLAERDGFAGFIREGWRGYVQRQTGKLVGDGCVSYTVSFEGDRALQDALPRLVRNRTIEPLELDEPARLPDWARPAILARDEDVRPRRVSELLALLREQLSDGLRQARFAEIQALASAWAELHSLRYAHDVSLDADQAAGYRELRSALDEAFLAWLKSRYAPLGGQRLPVPHHVFHVPHYMAYRRRQGPGDRVALVILDGMSLADWRLIGEAWRARHPDWRLGERAVLAQVPTVTAVSRQALVSGKRPAEFAATLDGNRAEARAWASFWAAEGVASSACEHAILRLGEREGSISIGDPRTRSLCVIVPDIDEIAHGTTMGSADVLASVRLWLNERSTRLEECIADLLARRFEVYVASDHGHVEARGAGQLSQGLTVDTKGQRARLYRDPYAAKQAVDAFDGAILWGQDGLLPDDVCVVMPSDRRAFAILGETVESHGGITLDEVVVPLVSVARG